MHSAAFNVRQRYLRVIRGDFGNAAGARLPQESAVLARFNEWHSWLIFACVFGILLFLDHGLLHRRTQRMTLTMALSYTAFWIASACIFCFWVYEYGDGDAAFTWMSGYVLEWSLSFDNVFVFHLIFSMYGTPDHLKHRPLYLGVIGAVVLRFLFILLGEYLLHSLCFMHIILGALLMYSGICALFGGSGDEDPSQNRLIQYLQLHVPFVGAYDEKGAFFVRVGEEERSKQFSASSAQDSKRHYQVLDFSQHSPQDGKGKWCATMLFLVVCCLEICDLVFAMDSVSAIVAQIDNIFLAVSSTVFAMLGLRAMFFIIDACMAFFSCLKYGIASVLIFIGTKLCLSHYYYFPPSLVCLTLVTTISLSILISVLSDLRKPKIKDVPVVTNSPDSAADETREPKLPQAV